MADPYDQMYSPPWAPHVRGYYTSRTIDPETKMPEAQRYEVVCERCGAKHGPTTCASGMVRSHIANFAQVHHHADALAKKE